LEKENTALSAKSNRRKTRPKDRYKVYGEPVPNGLNVSADTFERIEEVLKGNNKFLITHYVRKEPFSFVHRDKKGKAIGAGFSKGEPRGIIVAFKYGKKTLIGWSKWNEGAEENGKPLEMRRFTRSDSLRVAMARAFEDTILLKKKGYFMKETGRPVPKTVTRDMASFISRAVRYFKETPSNFIVKDEVA
jgi:hypothetical protein